MPMKKKIASAAFIAMMLFSLTACSAKNSSNTTPSNTTASNTPSEAQAKTEEETAAETAAKEKAQRLDAKAQTGYDLFFEKKYDEAIAVENEIIEEDPTFFKAYYIKGITQCYAGNYEEGSKNIDKALELNPDDYMARFNKALSLELYRHYDDALIWYNKALEISKKEWSYYGIASIYGRRGDVDNTVKYLKLAMEINPAIKEEAKTEKDFDPVRYSAEFKELIGE
jgi:tetratricopeptide (TPR) repeat protein